MATNLTELDTIFWNLETPSTVQQIAAFCELDSVPDVSVIQNTAIETLKLFPKLTQRLQGEEQPYIWEEDSWFDIGNHIACHVDSSISTYHDLLLSAGQLFSAQLNRERPLWRLIVISNSDPLTTAGTTCSEGVFCSIMLQIHHSYADGLSGLEFLEALCKNSAEESLESTACSLRQSRENGAEQDTPLQTPSLIASLSRAFGELTRFRGKGVLNAENSSMRQFMGITIPMENIKSIQNHFKCSANDIFLAAISGGLRKYYLRRRVNFGDQVALIPFSLRKLNERNLIDNRISAVGISLPCTTGDARERIRLISSETSRLKKRGGVGALLLAAKLAKYLPKDMQLWLCEFYARKTNFICTNLPGSRKAKFIGGAKILTQYPLAALMREHGLAFGAISYTDNLCLSLVYDTVIIKDPDIILDNIQQEVQEMLGTSAKPPEKIKKRSRLLEQMEKQAEEARAKR